MMNSQRRSRYARTVAVASLSAALLVGGATGSFAAAAPHTPLGLSTPSPSPQPSTSAAAITIEAAPTAVKAGERFTVTGRTEGIPVGTRLVVQVRKGGKWVTLPASTTAKQDGSYSLDPKIYQTGPQEVRVEGNKVTSPTATVIVN